jgi:hypothetical protein
MALVANLYRPGLGQFVLPTTTITALTTKDIFQILEDVEPAQIILVPISGAFAAGNFETAVVIRSLKQTVNSIFGEEVLPLGAPLADSDPALFAAERVDGAMLAALAEIGVQLRTLAKDPIASGFAADYNEDLANFRAALGTPDQGEALIVMMNLVGGVQAEVGARKLRPPRKRGVSKLWIAGGIALGLAVVSGVVYWQVRK